MGRPYGPAPAVYELSWIALGVAVALVATQVWRVVCAPTNPTAADAEQSNGAAATAIQTNVAPDRVAQRPKRQNRERLLNLNANLVDADEQVRHDKDNGYREPAHVRLQRSWHAKQPDHQRSPGVPRVAEWNWCAQQTLAAATYARQLLHGV